MKLAIVPAINIDRRKICLNRFPSHLCFCLLIVSFGCASLARPTVLPSAKQVIRDQLIIHSDFHLPSQHRILDDLTARRIDISNELETPLSDEPIHVYLFEDQSRFQKFMVQNHPAFPSRRAFFVKNDTTLMVYAYWGNRVAED